MSDITVGLVPVGVDRFAVVLSDPAAVPSLGLAVGEDPEGYTEYELRRMLHQRYGLSDADITTLVAATEAKRAGGG